MKTKVLFVCGRNAARSQMAEMILKTEGGGDFDVQSAGFGPARLDPLAVQVMGEEGLVLSANVTRSVFDYFKTCTVFHYVITVRDEARGERCPVFPGVAKRLHWDLEEPSLFEGTREEKLAKTREVRDRLRARISEWLLAVRSEEGLAKAG